MTEESGEKFCIERGWNAAEGGFCFTNKERASLGQDALYRVMKSVWLLAEPPTPHPLVALAPL